MTQTALVNLNTGAEQLRLRQLLDRETDRVRRAVEPALPDLARGFAVTGGK